MRETAHFLIISYGDFFLVYTIIMTGIYTFLITLAAVNLFMILKRISYTDYMKIISSDLTPGISILVPAYNEGKTIVENVKSLMSLEYHSFEIIIINDGSLDDTMDKMIDAFELKKTNLTYIENIKTKEIKGVYLSPVLRNLIVVDKENGGKADSLNAGINVSNHELFVAIDADCLIEKTSLAKIVRPFVEDSKRTVVVGGIVMIQNGCEVRGGFIEKVGLPKNPIAMFQTIEYLRAFLGGRLGWSFINGLLIVSGAFGVFKKDIVLKIGGYSTDNIGEDMDIVVRIHKYMRINKLEYRVVFIPDPVCWTQCPENLKSLFIQRKRWQNGLMDCLLTHKDMLFNPKYGVLGFFSVPYYWIFEYLEPIVSNTGYVMFILAVVFGFINEKFAIMFFIVILLYGAFNSLSCVILGEYTFNRYEKIRDFFTLVIYSIIENFGYKQLNSMWRLYAIYKYKYRKNQWGTIVRKQF